MSKENNLVSIDFETAYDAEYSLTKMSVHNYTHDDRFDAYLVSVYDGEDIMYVGAPERFDWSLLDGRIVAAHNMAFDYQVLLRIAELGRIPRMPNALRYVCTADMAAYLGVKRDLKTASYFGLGEEVSKATRAAMKGRASLELLDDPEVLRYAAEDARLCYEFAAKYLCDWPANEQRISELNREAGLRGIHMNVALVDKGISDLKPQLQAELEKIPWVKEGEKPLSPNALRKHGLSLGIPVPASMAKDSPDFLEWADKYGVTHPWVKAVGTYRSINALLAKVESLRSGIREDDTFPFSIKYFGAGTGRFSGGAGDSGGKFNMQNMPRKPMFGVDVRPMFTSRPGHKFIICDYNQIEARYLLWVSGDDRALGPMREGKSVYQAYAEAVGLAAPGSDLKHENPEVYQYVKAVCLGAGYGVGGRKFRLVAKMMAGLELSEEAAVSAVADYRRNNPKVVAFWNAHQDALAFSARRKDPTHQIELRSGRVLTYWEPMLFGREITAYQTRGESRAYLYGGKLTENEVQASCRDILCDAWLAIDKAGLPPVLLTVHDEIVVEAKDDEVAQVKREVERLMVSCSSWAEGLPLGVDSKVSDVYTK